MEKINVKIKKLSEDAVIPSYAYEGDICMDLTAIDVEYDVKTDTYIYHTGLAMSTDNNIGQFLFLRSSNCKKDCYLCNHVGIVDTATYRGEIQLRMKLRDSIMTMASNEILRYGLKESYTEVLNDMCERALNLEFAPYDVGDKIGQILFFEYKGAQIEVVDELNETDRGEGGFGSSGK